MTAGFPLRQSPLPFDVVDVTSVASEAGIGRSGSPVRSAPGDTAMRRADIEYVRHPKAKRYLLRVRLDGTVRVTIPTRGSKKAAVRFAASHADWIVQQQGVAARARAERRPAREHEQRQLLIRRAAEELPRRLFELAAKFALTVTRVSIRNQRWRWGSCSKAGHICLNWRLIEMPAWVRDYVLIHELMHLRRMDHSPAFWKLVAVAFPDYQHARAWLREHGRGLAED